MFSLGELKYSKRFTLIVLGIISGLIMSIMTYFYIFHSLKTLAIFDIGIWLIVGLCLKLLFTDDLMKWLFNVITAFNISLFVLIFSYILSRPFPYPMYANTGIRIILYAIFIVIFKKWVHPLYRQVVDRWQHFLFVSLGIVVNYIYILLSRGSIEESIKQNIILISIFSVLALFVYVTILWSMGSIIREYEFLNEKEQAKLHESLIYSQLVDYEEFVAISKHQRHDLRHHNKIIMQYLKNNDVKSAEEYLDLYDVSLMQSATSDCCENQIANAVFRMYEMKAKSEKIRFTTNVVFPENLTISQPEFGSMLSNILENALEACMKVNVDDRFIMFSSEIEDGNLKIELINSVNEPVVIKDNIPISTKDDGGIGMKSVMRIVDNYNGMIYFRQESHSFITQIILPA